MYAYHARMLGQFAMSWHFCDKFPIKSVVGLGNVLTNAGVLWHVESLVPWAPVFGLKLFGPLSIQYTNSWQAFTRRHCYRTRTTIRFYGAAIYTKYEQQGCVFGALSSQYKNSWQDFSRRQWYRTRIAITFYGIAISRIHEQLACIFGSWSVNFMNNRQAFWRRHWCRTWIAITFDGIAIYTIHEQLACSFCVFFLVNCALLPRSLLWLLKWVQTPSRQH